jgi:hypothetical protein
MLYPIELRVRLPHLMDGLYLGELGDGSPRADVCDCGIPVPTLPIWFCAASGCEIGRSNEFVLFELRKRHHSSFVVGLVAGPDHVHRFECLVAAGFVHE